MEGKKIVVLGGGTAGWLTALFCRKTFPSASVTLIENTAVGIVGVGEGSSLALTRFLNELAIDSFDVMKETGGSIKLGISFENWNGDDKKYFHSFRGQDTFSMPPHFSDGCEAYHFQTLIKDGLDVNEHTYITRLAYRNEIDLDYMPIALHFDASRVAVYLRNIAEQRNVVCVDGNFSHVEVDEDGFIKKLCLDSGLDFDCDFVFECSGFAKLLIGKHYQTGWTSYEDFLPMKKAISFRLDVEEDVKPYTQTTAMKYGWMWKIAIQDRIGAGYVFDSDYLKDEDAIDEVQQLLGHQIENVRSIPFDAGTHNQFWVKNCICVGLSSNFIEPLEATSIDCIVAQLYYLTFFINHMFKYNENSIAKYNQGISDNVESVSHFIYLHYLTKRSDTEFWKTFKERYPPPQKFEKMLGLIYENNLRGDDIGYFPSCDRTLLSYLEISNGLGLFKKPMDMDGYENLTPSVEDYKSMCDSHILDPTAVTKYSEFLSRSKYNGR